MKVWQLILRIVVTWLVFIFVAVLISSCRSIIEAPVKEGTHDTAYIKQQERDSTFEKDSVVIFTRADTVYNTRVQWRFRDRIVRDTVFRMRSDTITNVVWVEKELTSWERTKMSVGGYAIVCSVILVAIWFAKRLKGL